jgi:protein-S-isoprenylcysteine O-methyltransferase Ste14
MGLIYLISELLLTATRRSRSRTGTKQDRSTLLLPPLLVTRHPSPVTRHPSLPHVRRMNVEEEALSRALGPRYADYMKTTKRLLPGIY